MFASIFSASRGSQLKYESLGPTDRNIHKKRNHSFLQISISSALVLCSILQITLIFHALSLLEGFLPQAPNATEDPSRRVSNCSCRATIYDAISLGCAFDVLSLSWLPPLCRDAALTHEFATSGPGPNGEWEYWADVYGTLPLTLAEVAALAGRTDGYLFTSLGFHILHCSFYWRKQWRVVKGVGALAMEARYDQESHVEHCQQVFMIEGSRDKGMTESLVRLGGEFF